MRVCITDIGVGNFLHPARVSCTGIVYICLMRYITGMTDITLWLRYGVYVCAQSLSCSRTFYIIRFSYPISPTYSPECRAAVFGWCMCCFCVLSTCSFPFTPDMEHITAACRADGFYFKHFTSGKITHNKFWIDNEFYMYGHYFLARDRMFGTNENYFIFNWIYSHYFITLI